MYPQNMDLFHEARSICLDIAGRWTGVLQEFRPSLIDICAFGYTAGHAAGSAKGWQAGRRVGIRPGADGCSLTEGERSWGQKNAEQQR